MQCYEDVLKIEPNNIKALLNQGNLYLKEKNSLAFHSFSEAAKLGSEEGLKSLLVIYAANKDGFSALHLGYVYSSRRQNEQARKYWEVAQEKGSSDIKRNALYNIVMSYLFEGDSKNAIKYGKKALAVGERDLLPKLLEGVKREDKGQRKLYRKVLQGMGKTW